MMWDSIRNFLNGSQHTRLDVIITSLITSILVAAFWAAFHKIVGLLIPKLKEMAFRKTERVRRFVRLFLLKLDADDINGIEIREEINRPISAFEKKALERFKEKHPKEYQQNSAKAQQKEREKHRQILENFKGCNPQQAFLQKEMDSISRINIPRR